MALLKVVLNTNMLLRCRGKKVPFTVVLDSL